jgi:hypothetical protein
VRFKLLCLAVTFYLVYGCAAYSPPYKHPISDKKYVDPRIETRKQMGLDPLSSFREELWED